MKPECPVCIEDKKSKRKYNYSKNVANHLDWMIKEPQRPSK